MKKLIYFLLFTMISSGAFAQMTKLSYSEDFPEFDGASFIKILKNGNTMLIQMNKKTINTKLYGPDKKKKAEEILPVTVLESNLIYHLVDAVIEINGDVMMGFVGYPKATKRAASFYRLIIDGKTGKLKKEELLVHKDPIPVAGGYSATLGDVMNPSFEVAVDPNTGYYAVAVLRTFTKDKKDRVQVIHYDPMHNEINNAFLEIPKGFDLFNFRSMTVKGNRYVVLCTEPYVHDNKNSKNKILFSKITKGSKDFQTKEYNYEKKFRKALCTLHQEPLSDNITAIMSVQIDFEDRKKANNEYEVSIIPIKGDLFEIGKPQPLLLEKVSTTYQSKMGDRKDFQPYSGLIQDFETDQTGNKLILSEKTTTIISSSSYLELRDLGLTAMDNAGKELYSIYIPTLHDLYISPSHMAYYNYRHKLDYNYVTYPSFSGFIELAAGKKFNYIFINDTQKNVDQDDSDKSMKPFSHASLNTYYYKIDNKTGAMTKGLLFENPTSTATTNIVWFDRSDYNKESGELAGVYLEVDPKGKKHSGIVWFTLE